MMLLKLCVAFLLVHLSVEEDLCNAHAQKTEKDVNELFNKFWEWKLLNNPEFATFIGVFKYDDRVNELSLNSFRRRLLEVGIFLVSLQDLKKCVDVSQKPTLALNMDLLENDLKQYISGFKFHTYVWPMSVMEGPQNDPAQGLTLMRRRNVGDMNRIITRIRLFAHQIDEDIALLNEGIRIKQTLHKKSFESLIKIFANIATGEIEANPFFAPFVERPKEIKELPWKLVVESARMSVRDYIQPAYRRLTKFLKVKYLPNSRPQIGLSTVPLGKKYYQALLQYHTTTTLTPLQVHKIGLKEVERINKRMLKIKEQVKFDGTLDEFRQYLRSDKKFGFKDEKEMLDHYENIRSKVVDMLPKYFGVLPKTPFVIKPIPHQLAPTAPAAYYNQPSPGTPGTFFLNTYNPQGRRRYAAEPLFLHEAVPGHHLQIALKLENGSPVMFRRYTGMDTPYYLAPATFSMNTAFTEGWGLYSEYLGEEMGMYKDPYVLFGRLSGEMLRACRLVVDTGIHVLGWNRTRAIEFMKSNTADDLHDITAETDRYISIPGQACGYKIGELKLKELRALATKELGDKFDLRKFHDFVLKMANIPLTVLEKQVKLFIEKQKKM